MTTMTPTMNRTAQYEERSSGYKVTALGNKVDINNLVRILTIINSTNDLDNLTDTNYDRVIAFYTIRKIDSKIGSGEINKIRILLANILLSAQSTAYLYLNDDEYVKQIIDDELITSTLEQILDSDVEVQVLIAPSLFDKLSIKENIRVLEKKFSAFVINDLTGDIQSRQFFLTVDSTAYVEQGILTQEYATCSFNNSTTTSQLEGLFKAKLMPHLVQ